MIHRWQKYLLAVLLVITGVALAYYRTDREFINLQPTPGAAFALPLEEGHEYAFAFTVNRDSLTRLGFTLRLLRENVPSEDVEIILRRGETIIAQQSIASAFIDSEGFTQVRFSPPLATSPGEQLEAQIIVPPALSGTLGLQLRQIDQSFRADDIQFRVDGTPSPLPPAYQAYFLYHPGLAVQIGALLCIAAVWLIIPLRRLPPLAAGALISVVALLPVILLHGVPWSLLLAQALAWAGMYLLLERRALSFPARLVGAHVCGLTTYWALHSIGGTPSMLLLCVIPLAIYLALAFPRHSWVVSGLAAVIAAVSLWLAPPSTVPLGVASLRDVFLDPYQVAEALKTPAQLPWHHYGSYVGLFATILAALGLIRMWPKQRMVLGLLAGALVIYYSGALFSWPAAYAAIVLTYLIAYLAAHGLHYLQRYLGNTALPRYLMLAISLIILLDLLFVLTTTIEAPYL